MLAVSKRKHQMLNRFQGLRKTKQTPQSAGKLIHGIEKTVIYTRNK